MFKKKDNPLRAVPIQKSVKVLNIGELPDHHHILEYEEIRENYNGVEVYVLDSGIPFHDQITSLKGRRDHTGEGINGGNHGGHVGGRIASFIYGITKNTPLFSEKVLQVAGSGRFQWYRAGIKAANKSGAKIMSNSLGSPSNDSLTESEIMTFVSDHTNFFVVAGGNSSANTGFPANLSEKWKNVICVASGNIKKSRSGKLVAYVSDFSDTGLTTLTAQGEDVPSTITGDRIDTYNGSSMAQPEVCAVIAILVKMFQDACLEPFNCFDYHKLLAMEGSTIDLESNGFDGISGYGFHLPLGVIKNGWKMVRGEVSRGEIEVMPEVVKKGFFLRMLAFINFI